MIGGRHKIEAHKKKRLSCCISAKSANVLMLFLLDRINNVQ